jgi:hypothetical protein
MMAVILSIALTVTGCGANSIVQKSTSNESISADMAAPAPAPMAAQEEYKRDNDGNYNSTGEVGKGASERKMIETVHVTLVVDNVFEVVETITALSEQLNGFIQESRTWEGSEAKHGYLTARIPAERLPEALIELETLGTVRDKQRNGQDVTEQYFDREARLRNLEAQEERYLEILAEAKTTEDVINVERELVRVREQIEVYMGQLKYLDHQISLATLNIQLEEQKTINEIEKPSFIKAFDAAKVATKNSINMILTAISGLIIAIGYLIPLTPIIILAAYIYYRKVNSRRKNSSKAKDIDNSNI